DGARAPKLIELAGPRDYTAEDAAAAFAHALGRPVKLVPVPEAGVEPALVQAGMKPRLAALFREMYGAFNRGEMGWTGTPTRGRVELEEVVRGLVA
ncbi:MAG: NmrA family transcriptional regulator, partial [Polyangia bacterium]